MNGENKMKREKTGRNVRHGVREIYHGVREVNHIKSNQRVLLIKCTDEPNTWL